MGRLDHLGRTFGCQVLDRIWTANAKNSSKPTMWRPTAERAGGAAITVFADARTGWVFPDNEGRTLRSTPRTAPEASSTVRRSVGRIRGLTSVALLFEQGQQGRAQDADGVVGHDDGDHRDRAGGEDDDQAEGGQPELDGQQGPGGAPGELTEPRRPSFAPSGA